MLARSASHTEGVGSARSDAGVLAGLRSRSSTSLLPTMFPVRTCTCRLPCVSSLDAGVAALPYLKGSVQPGVTDRQLLTERNLEQRCRTDRPTDSGVVLRLYTTLSADTNSLSDFKTRTKQMGG